MSDVEDIEQTVQEQVAPLKSNAVLSMDLKTFRAYMRNLPPYKALERYRRALLKAGIEDNPDNAKKLKLVEKAMRTHIENGVTRKRKKANTGTRKEVTMVYADTKGNRELGRVGKEYTKVVWEDCEYEELPVKFRRRKRAKKDPSETGEKRVNLWIECVQKAKEDLEAPRWCVIRKTGEEGDVGVKVYNRAMELMKLAKAAS